MKTMNFISTQDKRKKQLAYQREKATKGTPVYVSDNQYANMELLQREINKGLTPKWYVVIHFNDGASSKKQQKRRLDDAAVEKDLGEVKKLLYEELYGRTWKKNKHRARSIWGIEYGKSQIKPHINLIIEALPYPYDDFRSSYVLFDRLLPELCKCLWRRSAYLQPVDIDNFTGLNSYCCKEADFRNATIIHNLTDYVL